MESEFLLSFDMKVPGSPNVPPSANVRPGKSPNAPPEGLFSFVTASEFFDSGVRETLIYTISSLESSRPYGQGYALKSV